MRRLCEEEAVVAAAGTRNRCEFWFNRHGVIARSVSDEAIHPYFKKDWIASLARNDGLTSTHPARVPQPSETDHLPQDRLACVQQVVGRHLPRSALGG